MTCVTLDAVAVAGRLGPLSGQIPAGQRLHLVGPNGAGKSTLLAAIAGLQEVTGRVTLNGLPLGHWPAAMLARLRAWSPQSQPPPFSQPLWHYLALHQPLLDDTGIERVVVPLGLHSLLERPVNRLSGGEWQRARLAAVLLQIMPHYNPEGRLLLLDEPYNNLDIAQQAALDGVLNKLAGQGVSVVLASHDLNHTLRHADTVWLMARGGLVTSGPPAQVMTPAVLQQVWPLPIRSFEAEGQRFLVADGAGGLPE